MQCLRFQIVLQPHQPSFSAVARLLVLRPMIDPNITRPIGILSRMGQRETKTVAAFKKAVIQSTQQIAT